VLRDEPPVWIEGFAGFPVRVHEAGIANIREPQINARQFHGMLKETMFLPNAFGMRLPFSFIDALFSNVHDMRWAGTMAMDQMVFYR
jgi:hypothetical protein